jgi:hypothetical protein
LLHVHKKAAETTFVRKIRTFNVDEIDGRQVLRGRGISNSIICGLENQGQNHTLWIIFA